MIAIRAKTGLLLATVGMLAGACGISQIPSADDRTFGGELVAIPTATWVDPDGCEHWVFDTGAEGFMTPKLQRDGRPICGPTATAAATAAQVPGPVTFGVINGDAVARDSFTMAADATFDVDSAVVKPEAARDLERFFDFISEQGFGFVLVEGHTDSSADPAYNLDLSLRRAQAVAAIAESYDITARFRGLGESLPRASNDTAEGRASNRRVEIRVEG